MGNPTKHRPGGGGGGGGVNTFNLQELEDQTRLQQINHLLLQHEEEEPHTQRALSLKPPDEAFTVTHTR